MWEKAHMQRTLLPGSRATCEESFIEIEILLVKTNLFVSGTVINKTERRTESCCEDGIPFAIPNIMSAIHPSFHFMPTCQVYFHVLQILESSPVFKIHPDHITSFVMNFNVQTISPFKILILNSSLFHNTLLPPAAYFLAHPHSKGNTLSPITHSELFELHIFLIFVTKQKKHI
jgi:hypothetical protein